MIRSQGSVRTGEGWQKDLADAPKMSIDVKVTSVRIYGPAMPGHCHCHKSRALLSHVMHDHGRRHGACSIEGASKQ